MSIDSTSLTNSKPKISPRERLSSHLKKKKSQSQGLNSNVQSASPHSSFGSDSGPVSTTKSTKPKNEKDKKHLSDSAGIVKNMSVSEHLKLQRASTALSSTSNDSKTSVSSRLSASSGSGGSSGKVKKRKDKKRLIAKKKEKDGAGMRGSTVSNPVFGQTIKYTKHREVLPDQDSDKIEYLLSGRESALVGNYIIHPEPIGQGSFGTVHKALNTSTSEIIAVKRFPCKKISTENINNIISEISLLKTLNHQNIVKFIGFVKNPNYIYFMLEYMELGSLTTLLDQFGPFPEAMAKNITRQVVHGVAYLHAEGVVHRDIKGSNVLIDKSGLVKLSDFGVSASLNSSSELRFSIVGSPYWMSPELITRSGHSAPCDLWSIACLICQLLTGLPPYADLPPAKALIKIVTDESMPMPAVKMSDDLRDLLERLWCKNADERPSAEEVKKDEWLKEREEEKDRTVFSMRIKEKRKGKEAREGRGAVEEDKLVRMVEESGGKIEVRKEKKEKEKREREKKKGKEKEKGREEKGGPSSARFVRRIKSDEVVQQIGDSSTETTEGEGKVPKTRERKRSKSGRELKYERTLLQ